ncbi:MAG: right-handed parallel beta-helix repeat-containing protein [Anaerolineae bacterium]
MYLKKWSVLRIGLMMLALPALFVTRVAAWDMSFTHPDRRGDQHGSAQLGAAVANAPATGFTVNNVGDDSDATPGDGTCETATGNGICTLRAAIEETNALSGSDVITFQASISLITLGSPLPGLEDASGGTTIRGNDVGILGTYAGTGTHGFRLSSDGNKLQGLIITGFDGSGVRVYGDNNVIGTDGDGVGDDSEGNVISNNNNAGIVMRDGASGNRVAGNWIGLTADGTGPAGNAAEGIVIFAGASANIIGTNGDGTSDELERNVISGNGEYGVEISGSETTGNVVAGNYIGVDIAGGSAISNTWSGVMVTGDSTNTRIGTNGDGTSDELEGNVVSGNGGAGVRLDNGSSGNLVAGNLIGTNAAGDAAIPNDSNGILIQYGSANNLVGTNGDGQSDALERNVVSGNNSTGIKIYHAGTDNNVVAGNYVGTNAAGDAAIPNGGRGIVVQSCANTHVGGTTTVERNVVSGNGFDGIQVYSATTTLVQGNYIGTDAIGISALGNTYYGVNVISGANGTIVGGTASGARNVIAFNGLAGIRVSEYTPTQQLSYDNSLRGNIIHSNGELGIDLWPEEGVTPNDTGDGDEGSNHLQNYPVLSAASSGDGEIVIRGALNSSSNTTFNLDFYANTACDPSGYGEGERYLGAAKMATDGHGNLTFSTMLTVDVLLGDFVTATATDAHGNTSEFSACIVVTELSKIYLPLVIRNN